MIGPTDVHIATVLFADIVDFTKFSGGVSVEVLLGVFDHIF